MTESIDVLIQSWEESERGWGTRPDGYSLHLTADDQKAFIKEYWARMPDSVPDEYSRPIGEPGTASVRVGGELYEKLQEGKHGVWLLKLEHLEYISSGELEILAYGGGWQPVR